MCVNWSVVNMKFALCVFCLICSQASFAHLKDNIYVKLSFYYRAFSGVVHWRIFLSYVSRLPHPDFYIHDFHNMLSVESHSCSVESFCCTSFCSFISQNSVSVCHVQSIVLGIGRKKTRNQKRLFLFYICTSNFYFISVPVKLPNFYLSSSYSSWIGLLSFLCHSLKI